LQGNVELDRMMAAREHEYAAEMVKLLQPELTTKSDIIVGVPRASIGEKFAWPWGRVNDSA
jgi:hypothetical protein